MRTHKKSQFMRGACCALAIAALLVTGCGDSNNPSNTTGGDDPFVFSNSQASAYTRVDRMGMPAVATVLIQSANKNAYNAANPSDDVGGMFVGDIVAVIDALHAALDDDLMGLGLTPCTGGGAGSCVAQGAPLILPDSIQINPAAMAGFPNGRRLADPVIDLTLAVLLLDLGVHAVTTFSAIPVNPPANDLAFPGVFPYLAPAH